MVSSTVDRSLPKYHRLGMRSVGCYTVAMTFAYDCRECSACCRDGSDGRIGVSTEDIVRWKRIGRADIAQSLVPGHFGVQAFPAREDGACVHLGTPHNPHDCSIYAIRGSVCHQLQPGEPQCLAYRRVAGLPT